MSWHDLQEQVQAEFAGFEDGQDLAREQALDRRAAGRMNKQREYSAEHACKRRLDPVRRQSRREYMREYMREYRAARS